MISTFGNARQAIQSARQFDKLILTFVIILVTLSYAIGTVNASGRTQAAKSAISQSNIQLLLDKLLTANPALREIAFAPEWIDIGLYLLPYDEEQPVASGGCRASAYNIRAVLSRYFSNANFVGLQFGNKSYETNWYGADSPRLLYRNGFFYYNDRHAGGFYSVFSAMIRKVTQQRPGVYYVKFDLIADGKVVDKYSAEVDAAPGTPYGVRLGCWYCTRISEPLPSPSFDQSTPYPDIVFNEWIDVLSSSPNTAQNIRKFVREGHDPNYPACDYGLLTYAVRNCETDAVRGLIQAGAKVNGLPSQTPPVQMALQRGYDKLELLLQCGASTTQISGGQTALMAAATLQTRNDAGLWGYYSNDQISAIKILLKYHAPINERNAADHTAVHYALAKGCIGSAKYLETQGGFDR